ncbi:MAG: glycoside hydrolase family 43 protein [Verrucomicrobiales bacterium]|nr:glycoside hydrolase family 43 protein [Verrucomicrobiales bacterium]
MSDWIWHVGWRWRLAASCMVWCGWLWGGFPAVAGTFTNPVVASGADPWVIRWEDDYYLCQSKGGGISVARSRRLQDIGKQEWTEVWRPPAGTAYSKELWAPELHRLDGRWFIYVAADDGNNFNHRMYALEGTSSDPREPFTLRGKLAASTDRWAIDGTVLRLPDGRLYFIWSGWEGTENVAQDLYIARMENPWTLAGERVRISRPEHDWEQHGKPWVNEGPQVLWNGDQLFIVYSASGSWTDDYCFGQLRWLGGDPMDPKAWRKSERPVFARTKQVFGPGHGSFVKSRDGKEDWLVYHAAKHSGAGWNRMILMQKFGWNADGSPNFGEPLPPGVPMDGPSGE